MHRSAPDPRHRAAIRPAYRVLAAFFGAMMVLMALFVAVMLVLDGSAHGWSEVRETLPWAFPMLLGLPLGIGMLAAARTGRDPILPLIPALFLPREREPRAIGPLFRALAWLIGPYLIVVGIAAPVIVVATLFAEGWSAWAEMVMMAGSLWICLPVGLKFLHAARTGLDPYDGAADDAAI